jgi:hypothetical protein
VTKASTGPWLNPGSARALFALCGAGFQQFAATARVNCPWPSLSQTPTVSRVNALVITRSKVVVSIHIPGGDMQTRDRAGFDFECTVGLCTQYDFDLVSISAIHPAARVSDRQVGVAIAIEVGKRKAVVQPDR